MPRFNWVAGKALLVLMLSALAVGAAPASAAPCIGSGGAECPYQGVAELDERPARSPYLPAGVAVSHTTHDIYLADRFANAVKQYAQDGTFLRSWGGSDTFAIDDLNQPAGVTLDAGGDVWVAAVNTSRISEFDADGDILSTFGTGQGPGNGQFVLPEDVAIAPNGHVWVADTANNRIQELAADGSFLAKYGAPGPGDIFGLPSGSGLGEFDRPSGITVAPNGDVYVADTDNNRLQRLPAGTTSWEAIGTPGGGVGPGDFFAPRDVIAEPDGRLFVAEASRTQRRAAGGAWSDVSGSEGGDAIDVENGKVFLVQSEARRLRVLSEADGTLLSLINPIEPAAGELRDPQATAVDGAGNLFVADTDAHRIVKLNAVSGAFIDAFGTQGNGDGQFNNPWGVAVDGAGDVFVADTGNNRIQKLAADGTFIDKWGTSGVDAGEFGSPHGVAVAADGSLIVADAQHSRIQRSNAARTTWTVIGGRDDEDTGSAIGEFYFPSDVAVTSAGDVWASDPGNDRVQKLPAGSATWQAFGSNGTADGQFDYPRGIDVTADGADVFVADTNNNRVQRLSGAGAFEAKWGASTFGEDPCPGSFSQPWGIAVAPDGAVLVSDENRGHVSRFTFGSGSIPACDRTAPAVSPESPADSATGVPSTPSFTATGGIGAGDDDALSVRVLRTSGAATLVVRTLTSTDHSGTTTWTVPWSGAPLPDGLYMWEAVQGDASGNEGVSERRSFRVGPIPLEITQLSDGVPVSGNPPGANPVIEDQTPTFRGTASNGGGDPTTITVHLDRYNGSSFVPDVHTFTTTRDGDGNWTRTSPIVLQPETWQVRVTQGTNESAGWWFQLQALTITQLNDGTPVSGNPPGANPVIFDTTPTFKGTALSGSGASNTVTVHLDRWNGSSFIQDGPVFNTTRGPNGDWTATAPTLNPETWQVRVTQVVSGVTRTSQSWWFQLRANPPLAVTELNTGVPVSGSPPGANPVMVDPTPTFKGTAGIAPGESSTVTVHLDRNSTSGFVNDAHTFDATRDANGNWTATAPRLVPETWRVRVTQGGASSASWHFQLQAKPAPTVTLTAPAADAVVADVRPTFSGGAGTAPGDSPTITVELQQERAGGGFADIAPLTATRSGSSWSVKSDRDFAAGRYYARAHQTDDTGNDGTSGYVLFTVAGPPRNVAPPTMSGPSAAVGVTLSGAVGTWTGYGTINYIGAWQRCEDTVLANCETVGGGVYPEGSTFTIRAEDVGYRFVWVVFAFNEAGGATAYSASFTGVVPDPDAGSGRNGAGAGNPSIRPPLPARAPAQRSNACQTKLNFGPIGVEGECLKRVGLTWESTAEVSVNGIHLVPSGGRAKVVIDPMNLRVGAEGQVAIVLGPANVLGRTLGPYTLWKGSFDWVFQPSIQLPDVPGLATAIDFGRDYVRANFSSAKPGARGAINLERYSYADLQRLPGLERLPNLPRLPGLGLPDFSTLTVADLKALRIPTIDDIAKMQIPAYYLQNVQLPPLALDTRAASMFGFGLDGKAAMQLVDDGANFNVALNLRQLGNLSAEANFNVTNGGQIVTRDVKAHADEVNLGIVSLRPFDISFEGATNTWEGSATGFLPFPNPVGLGASLRVVDGKLRRVGVNYDGNFALGTSGVFLSHIDFVYDDGPPTNLTSGINLSAGPKVGSLPRAIGLDGRFTYVGGNPAKFALTGQASVAGYRLADAGMEYHTNGYFHAYGRVSFHVDAAKKYGIAGSVDGWATKSRFNLAGDMTLTTPGFSLGAHGVLSSVGLAGCATIQGGWFNGFSLGAGYKWGAASIDWIGGTCDMKPFSAVYNGAARASQAGFTKSFKVARGERVLAYAVHGQGAPPKITLTGPGGVTVTTPAGSLDGLRTDRYLLIQDDTSDTTYVIVGKPGAGNWTIAGQAGSAPIVRIDHAGALPDVSVKAQMLGKGRSQQLRWTLVPIKGQTVRFVERAGDVARVIGETRAASGSVRFAPSDGKAGRRRIEAVVEQDGLVRETLTVARFVAPRSDPARPGRVRAKLRRGKLVVTWARAAGSVRYRVLATVSGGRRILVSVSGAKRKATIPGVFSDSAAAVKVYGVDAANRAGQPGRASLRPKRVRKPVLKGLKAPRRKGARS